jgi:surfeit locus 1 family protein
VRHYSFKPSAVTVIAVALAVPLFCGLGFWQIERAEQKAALQELLSRRQREPLLALTPEQEAVDPIRYRRVQVDGTYDAEHQFLLDNQVHDGQAGYHVLTPLRFPHSQWAVLVNRGWIALDSDRSRLPAVPIAADRVSVTGMVERFPSVAWKLSGAEVPAPGWPARVQVLEREPLEQRLGYRLLPYQVLLDATMPNGYVREWKPAHVDAAKNRGYAMQWFSFAVLAAALFLWHGFRRVAAVPGP